MVRQAQLIYCVFITGYMFRAIYRSSSGLLTRQSVTAMHVGSHHVYRDKIRGIHKMFMLVK